jgi:hypothetical protein
MNIYAIVSPPFVLFSSCIIAQVVCVCVCVHPSRAVCCWKCVCVCVSVSECLAVSACYNCVGVSECVGKDAVLFYT